MACRWPETSFILETTRDYHFTVQPNPEGRKTEPQHSVRSSSPTHNTSTSFPWPDVTIDGRSYRPWKRWCDSRLDHIVSTPHMYVVLLTTDGLLPDYHVWWADHSQTEHMSAEYNPRSIRILPCIMTALVVRHWSYKMRLLVGEPD